MIIVYKLFRNFAPKACIVHRREPHIPYMHLTMANPAVASRRIKACAEKRGG